MGVIGTVILLMIVTIHMTVIAMAILNHLTVVIIMVIVALMPLIHMDKVLMIILDLQQAVTLLLHPLVAEDGISRIRILLVVTISHCYCLFVCIMMIYT